MSSEIRPETGAFESKASEIARLVGEARLAADDQIHELETVLLYAARLAGEVAEGGPAYAVGVRALCRSLTTIVQAQQRSLQGLRPAAGLPAPVCA